MSRRGQVYSVVLHGKWGGSRTVRVTASSEEEARRVVRDTVARISERIGRAFREEIKL